MLVVVIGLIHTLPGSLCSWPLSRACPRFDGFDNGDGLALRRRAFWRVIHGFSGYQTHQRIVHQL